ncbi:MAG: hypothetical protein OEY49_18845, partial [Candidatus Heimdallarchaeota archaeon]|nr:hypothetical protein [Candidatus Heimdallarchaeota archaeon]
CSEHHEKIYSIDDWEFKPPLHPNCRCTILSTVAEEYGLDNLDNLEEGKSIDGIGNWFPSKKQAELELRYDDSLVKIFHDRKDKTVREIAVEFDNIVSFQTIGKWMVILKEWEESKHPRDDKGSFSGSPSGRLISNYKEHSNGPNAAEGDFPEGANISQFNNKTKIILKMGKFQDKESLAIRIKSGMSNRLPHNQSPHFTKRNQYYSVINNASDVYEKNPHTLVFVAKMNKSTTALVYVNPHTLEILIGTGFVNIKSQKHFNKTLSKWKHIKSF